MPRPHRDGSPQKATVPLWVVAWPGSWTLVAAVNREQAEAIGWRMCRVDPWRVRVKRARAKDVERARSWAKDGDPDAQAMLRLAGKAVDDNPPPEVEDEQLSMI